MTTLALRSVTRQPWPKDGRYLVGDDGSIVGPHKRVLSPVIQRGRAGITLSLPGGRFQRVAVSVVVCETFHGPRPEAHHAAHENGDALDNRASNLSWKSAAENEADKRRHGTALQGVKHHQAKLDEDAVRSIRRQHAAGVPRGTLAKMYGVSPAHINRIASRGTWTHI